MKINPKYVSFYYQGMEEVPDMELDKKKTALLVIDMQKEFVNRDCGDYLKAKEDFELASQKHALITERLRQPRSAGSGSGAKYPAPD